MPTILCLEQPNIARTASLFYVSLLNLDISAELFPLISGETLGPTQLLDFTNELSKQLLNKHKDDSYLYAYYFAKYLRDIAERGWSVKIYD